MFTTALVADRHYRSIGLGFGGITSLAQELAEVRRDIEFKRRRLASIRQQLEVYEAPESAAAPVVAATPNNRGEDVFLVHGRDGETKP